MLTTSAAVTKAVAAQTTDDNNGNDNPDPAVLTEIKAASAVVSTDF